MKTGRRKVLFVSLALTILFSVIILLRYDYPRLRQMYRREEQLLFLMWPASISTFFVTAIMLLPLTPNVAFAIGISLIIIFIISSDIIRNSWILPSDDFRGFIGIAMIFSALVILGYAYYLHCDRIEKEEEKIRERAQWELYFPIYKKIFPDAKHPEHSTAMIRELRAYISQEKNKAIENYQSENHIQQEVDSCSNLGLCGISSTHFFYYIKEFSVNIKEFPVKYTADIANEVKSNGCQLKTAKIPLDSIKYYKIEGSIHYTSNVQGGGVNLKGAALGSLVGGDAGAIIGSRVGTETSTTVTSHDNRKLTIFYEEDGESIKTLEVISTNYNQTLNAFRKLIPQKEEAMVMLEAKETPVKSQKSSVDELLDLKKLLDCGIITQAEFDAKKKQLLGL